MKTLYESLLDDDLVDKTDKMIKDEIKAFLKANYKGSIKISRKPNNDNKYEVSSTTNIEVKNKNITSLTNGMFIWANVDGYFNCVMCKSLKSLEGAPKEIAYNFNCSHCIGLESLEGAPEKVGGCFYCSYCSSLKSLKGAPKEVGRGFYCSSCISLESLEDALKKVGEDFYCDRCNSLKSLAGAPKEVGRNFYCNDCAGKFTENDVQKISKVKGKIIC